MVRLAKAFSELLAGPLRCRHSTGLRDLADEYGLPEGSSSFVKSKTRKSTSSPSNVLALKAFKGSTMSQADAGPLELSATREARLPSLFSGGHLRKAPTRIDCTESHSALGRWQVAVLWWSAAAAQPAAFFSGTILTVTFGTLPTT
jgi:hypothetical protein